MAASVLVVSNPEDQDAILAPLHKAGVSDVLARDGSDDTLALCGRARPDVVIVNARLGEGDARAFISAMRELDPEWTPRVILIGELDGPLRTPLDVSDLDVDHFLVQPLSAKALVFATRSAMAATTTRPPRAGNQPRAANDEQKDAGARAGGEAAPAWRARTEILGGGGASEDGGPATGGPATGGPATGGPATGAPEMDESASARPGSEPGAEAEWQQSMDASAASFVGPVVSSVVHELTPLPEPAPFMDEDSDELDDFDLRVELDIGAELEEDLARAAEADANDRPEDAPPAPDRTFASELQRKMSAMEERLLAREGRAAAASGVPEAVPEPVSEMLGRAATGADADAGGGIASGTMAGRADEGEQGLLRRGHGDFAALLERMYRERFTGRVTLRRRLAEKAVVFQHGRPVFASSNQPEDRVGALLVRAGKITDEQAEQSHRRALDTGKRMGEVLVEMGFLKRRELLPAVRLQLEEIVYSLFAWDQGEYTVAPGEPLPGERIRLSTHPAAMVLEGVRRKYGRELLEELVGPPDSRLEILDPAQRDTIASVADLSPAEHDVMLAFDGERSLAEIAERSRQSRFVVYQLAYGLIAFGAARVRAPGDTVPPDADAGAWHAAGDGDGDGDGDLDIDRKRIRTKHALVDDADYFTILGVRRDATSFEIQRAYEAACRDYAPAEVPPPLRNELERELAEIREALDEAYRVLRNDDVRSAYLTNLRD